MKRRAAMAVMVAVLAAGCAFKAPRVDGGDPREDARRGEVWEPRPTAARVYPSTRFAMRDGQPVLEARIELIDEMGDPIKAVGDFRLELYAPGALRSAEAGQRGRQLYVWRVPMWTLAQQRLYHDPITQTYLFRLSLDTAEHIHRDALLRAIFVPDQGDMLEAEAVVAGVE